MAACVLRMLVDVHACVEACAHLQVAQGSCEHAYVDACTHVCACLS